MINIFYNINYTATFVHRWGKKASAAVGCSSFDDEKELIACLRQVPAETFALSDIQNGPNSAQAVIDANFTSNPFLPKSPREILKSGIYNSNISILLGCNRWEMYSIQII